MNRTCQLAKICILKRQSITQTNDTKHIELLIIIIERREREREGERERGRER